jgi:hypothetical protein
VPNAVTVGQDHSAADRLFANLNDVAQWLTGSERA